MHRECALDHSKEPASLVKITRLVTGLAWGPGRKRVVAFKDKAAIIAPALPSILGRSEYTYCTEALCMAPGDCPHVYFQACRAAMPSKQPWNVGSPQEPMALWSAVGSKPTTLGTCVPQAGALTNWAASYSQNYLLLWGPGQSKYKGMGEREGRLPMVCFCATVLYPTPPSWYRAFAQYTMGLHV